MLQNEWTSMYHAALVEIEPRTLKEKITLARKAINERLSQLPPASLQAEGREELHKLWDARRTLDLLERTTDMSAAAS